MNRRHFLKHAAGASLMSLPAMQFVQNLKAATPQLQRDGKSLIIFWMGGGPPTIDLWDLKYGAPTAFDDEPIETSAEGVKISPYMPKIAEQFKNLVAIRSLSTTEGDHMRGTQLMHTGKTPSPVVAYPSIGSMASYQFRDKTKDLALPSFISVGGGNNGPGYLGMNYAPFAIQNAGAPPANIKAPPVLGAGLDEKERIRRRQRMFYTIEDGFSNGLLPNSLETTGSLTTEADREAARKKFQDATIAHKEVYGKAFSLVASGGGKVFEFDAKDQKSLEDYGKDGFGRGCLLARKLVEAGVTSVEVNLGGWDLHANTQMTLKNQRLPVLDNGMGSLVRDLVDRGMWKNTVVVWMGEFGRTPRINQNAGRDHWARCWSIVVGGGAIKGGQAYGATNKEGNDIVKDKCSISDVFATLYKGLGLNPTDQHRDNLGRPLALSDGKILKGLI
jgi:hypothetical protein